MNLLHSFIKYIFFFTPKLPMKQRKLFVEIQGFHGADDSDDVFLGQSTAYWLVDVNVSEKHAVSIFRAETLKCWLLPASQHGALTQKNIIRNEIVHYCSHSHTLFSWYMQILP
jgi:hypothetical protein